MVPLDRASRLLLAVNAGSSSLKCALFACTPDTEVVARHAIVTSNADAGRELLAWVDTLAPASTLVAVGHRIVHGGQRYCEPQLITPLVRRDLDRLVAFAPNHLPRELALVDEVAGWASSIPQVACFDTAFHQRIPEVARRLPIPGQYVAQGVQKYGFHGLSYAFLMEELARIDGDAVRGRLIFAHLGNGSSLAAIREGAPVDTTMAFTPIGGVVMSTRSGDLDPGVITYLARAGRLSADALEDVLSRQSGLVGVSGTTGDMQQLLAREATDPAARLAVEIYIYSITKAIGALTAVLQGLDTLVFTGGIGEHASSIRARICRTLAFAGLALDPDANERHAPMISAPTSRVAIRVIPTNEELMIARATYRVTTRTDDHAGNR